MATKKSSRAKRATSKSTSRSAHSARATKTTAKRGTRKPAAKRRAPLSRPGKAGPVNEWMELRRSPIQGLGAFARKEIPRGTRFLEYTGEKISNAEADRRYDDDAMTRHHTFLFILNERTVVDAARGGNEARFLNHSCDPNCETVIERGHIWIEAVRNIPAGAELLYDYQYEDDPDYTDEQLFEFYGCRCGAAKCRGTIVKTRRRKRA